MNRRSISSLALAACIFAGICPSGSAAETHRVKFPPWSARNSSQLDFTVYGTDSIPDLHGDPSNDQLVIFAAGNQFMTFPELLTAFKKIHPEVQRIFFETLPEGVLAQQMKRGSIQFGNLIVSAKPDVFMTGTKSMKRAEADHLVAGDQVTYASNLLVIEVARGNPKHIDTLHDLGRSDVRVSMPNPAFEGIGAQIESSYQKAGGEALATKIMQTKLAAGTTTLTHIHHRETPVDILIGMTDAGPVWLSEALYQQRIGNPLEYVSIPAAENSRGNYVASAMAAAPHRAAAAAFVKFLASPAAQAIFKKYGFDAAAAAGSAEQPEASESSPESSPSR